MIYTTGGDLVHVFGEHGSGLGQFDGPTGVSVDSDGLIYIADNVITIVFKCFNSQCLQCVLRYFE